LAEAIVGEAKRASDRQMTIQFDQPLEKEISQDFHAQAVAATVFLV
jgi:hypothetical protein